jgi:hypothetical protein
MNPIFAASLVGLVIAQLAVPRRLAFLPMLLAGCHLGNIEVLPEMTPARLLILVGLARGITAGYCVWPTKSSLDRWFFVFAAIALISTFGHKADPWVPSPFAARVGLVLNVCGAYLYGRTYLPDLTTFRTYAYILPLILIPLAMGVTAEKKIARNLYSTIGASSEGVSIREGKVRSKGPFRHPILAGTAGATALPFALLLWRTGRKKAAVVGTAACLAIVAASGSSGPMAAAGLSAGCVFVLWKWRQHLSKFLWACVALALLYSLISGRGPWFIMARIDLAGGSTGWHRAYLIDQGFRYFGQWWLWGTDVTRHWMPTGVSWSPMHTDLTNYYLHLGVIGGLPLVLCLIAFMASSFRALTSRMEVLRRFDGPDEFLLWCAGTSIFAHALSFISISYFDQMYVFFYMLLGAVPGLVGTSSLPLTSAVPEVPAAEPVLVKSPRYYS